MKCINLSKDLSGLTFQCNEPVLTEVDKSVPSIRVSMGDKGEFIWMYPERVPVGNFCPFHKGLRDEKRLIEVIDRKKRVELI